jgi:hypothetical protein
MCACAHAELSLISNEIMLFLSMIFNLSNSYCDKIFSFTFFNLYDFQQKLQCENAKASAPTSWLSSTFSNCFSHKTKRQNTNAAPHHLLQIAHMKKMENNFTQA